MSEWVKYARIHILTIGQILPKRHFAQRSFSNGHLSIKGHFPREYKKEKEKKITKNKRLLNKKSKNKFTTKG